MPKPVVLELGELVYMRRCEVCGHPLIASASRERGLGPKCHSRLVKKNGPGAHSAKKHTEAVTTKTPRKGKEIED